MASHQLIGTLPAITLDAGCTVTVEAINPTTGATITGVILSAVALYGINDASVPQAFDYESLFTHATDDTE